MLEQITRELNVEALPTAIPESIIHDVSAMQIGDTLMLSALAAPEGVTLLDDLEEIVLATLSPPRLQAETRRRSSRRPSSSARARPGEPPSAAEAGDAEDASGEE